MRTFEAAPVRAEPRAKPAWNGLDLTEMGSRWDWMDEIAITPTKYKFSNCVCFCSSGFKSWLLVELVVLLLLLLVPLMTSS